MFVLHAKYIFRDVKTVTGIIFLQLLLLNVASVIMALESLLIFCHVLPVKPYQDVLSANLQHCVLNAKLDFI